MYTFENGYITDVPITEKSKIITWAEAHAPAGYGYLIIRLSASDFIRATIYCLPQDATMIFEKIGENLWIGKDFVSPAGSPLYAYAMTYDADRQEWDTTSQLQPVTYNDHYSYYGLVAGTLKISVEGQEYTPGTPDDLIFAKLPDMYAFNVGVNVNEKSEYIQYIYRTKEYTIKLSWTSPRSGTDYEMQLNGLTNRVPIYLYFPTIGANVNFDTQYGSTARAVRLAPGSYSTPEEIPTEYSELTPYGAVTTFTLQQLVDFMQTQTAGASEQDAFTVISAAFIAGGQIVETKTLDYSSLYGEDIDINGGTVSDPNDTPPVDDTNVYTDSIELTTPTLTATGVFNRAFILDGNGVNDLCDFLYNANDTIFEEIAAGVLTRGNPIESLVDLRLYPFDVQQLTGAASSQKIVFGRTQTDIVGVKLPADARAVISLGSCIVPRFYQNFLDYQMTASLYIPFCGVVDLPIDRILNHEISIQLIVDYVTGACTAVVFVDKIPLLYQPGVIGVAIPMTATNSADFSKSVLGNIIKSGAQVAAGGLDALPGVVGGVAEQLYSGSHIQTAGASSPQVSLYQPKNAYLLLSIVNPAGGVYDDTYAKTQGYACFTPVGQIGYTEGTGLNAFTVPRLDIPQATEEEKEEIKRLLGEGVYM